MKPSGVNIPLYKIVIQSTVSIYHLVDGEYQVNQFQQQDMIISPTFPDLQLSVVQVFDLK